MVSQPFPQLDNQKLPYIPVYIVRLYVLAIVLSMLVAAFLSSAGYIFCCFVDGIPFNTATFLSITASVQGLWWEEQLSGTGILSTRDMKRLDTLSVMFGIDKAQPDRIGLAPKVIRLAEWRKNSHAEQQCTTAGGGAEQENMKT